MERGREGERRRRVEGACVRGYEQVGVPPSGHGGGTGESGRRGGKEARERRRKKDGHLEAETGE